MKAKYKLSRRSYDRLDGVKAVIIAVLTEAIKDSPYDFGIPKDGGRRTPQRQQQLYAIGRTVELNRKPVTWTLNSKHLPNKIDGTSHAFDFYAYVNGKASWELKYLEPIARHIQKVAKEQFNLKIDWGQDLWGKDGGHMQIKL